MFWVGAKKFMLKKFMCFFRPLLCFVGPKDLSHPLLTAFGIFLFSNPLFQAAWFATLALFSGVGYGPLSCWNRQRLLGRSFYLRVSHFYLLAYGQLAWSFLLTVEIRFGLFAYWGKSVWSFLLTVPPRPEIRFGLFFLRFAPSGPRP